MPEKEASRKVSALDGSRIGAVALSNADKLLADPPTKGCVWLMSCCVQEPPEAAGWVSGSKLLMRCFGALPQGRNMQEINSESAATLVC